MEKNFKKLKFDLLVYRHIYIIYAIIIAISTWFVAVNIRDGSEKQFIIIQIAVIAFLIVVAIFRLPKERRDIKTKSDIFLLTLMSLKETMKSRITKIMVLENEFDVLKEKDDGICLIQERIANIHISTIKEGIETARKLGYEYDQVFMTYFSLPDSITELKQVISEIKTAAEKDRKNISMMIEKIETLYAKF